MILEEKLNHIKERCENATEGPWYTDINDVGMNNVFTTNQEGTVCQNIKRTKDVNFIAHARTDVPMLLEMIEVVEDEVESEVWEYLKPYLENIADKYK